ncbi:hypothetical protein B0H15DRAFT_766425 [Mycena belliarum]|uniref:Uncharacterized protein n=1 Tax=Mycena belliarum TaxID=1033014 RepID=A0AAD6UQW0_9AGAR|nr:hypothetical protein B0H15DRAFT_24400 [Mycena belliae]KAJ7104431.1 hypothetical protein B0H15DRAFT_766425 [Mycena belliae]
MARAFLGAYTTYSKNHDISIDASILFVLACGPIMYAFALRPDTLSRSYKTWIMDAAGFCRDGVQLNCKVVREQTLDAAALDRIIAHPATTPANRASLATLRDASPHTHLRCGPCAAMHPDWTSCWTLPPVRFAGSFRRMLPIQLLLHFAPLLLRWRVLRAHPARVLLRVARGCVRSATFLGALSAFYQSTVCLKTQLHARLAGGRLPAGLVDLLVSPASFWMAGLVSGLSLLLEEPHRRAGVALYVVPKAIESAWAVARNPGPSTS